MASLCQSLLSTARCLQEIDRLERYLSKTAMQDPCASLRERSLGKIAAGESIQDLGEISAQALYKRSLGKFYVRYLLAKFLQELSVQGLYQRFPRQEL